MIVMLWCATGMEHVKLLLKTQPLLPWLCFGMPQVWALVKQLLRLVMTASCCSMLVGVPPLVHLFSCV